jgi:hypothetical protein
MVIVADPEGVGFAMTAVAFTFVVERRVLLTKADRL